MSDYKAPHETGRIDITARVRQELDTIILSHESSVSAEYHFLAGEYDRVLTLLGRQAPNKLSSRDRNVFAWTCIIQGNKLYDAAKSQDLRSCIGRQLKNFDTRRKWIVQLAKPTTIGEMYYSISVSCEETRGAGGNDAGCREVAS